MGEAAATADRKVAVYCGAGLPVEITLKLPTTVAAFGTAVVEALRSEGHCVHPSRVVLWRVGVGDVDALQERALAEPGFVVDPTETITQLPSEAAVTGATFAGDTRVWVQLLGGGTGAWGAAAGCSPWGPRNLGAWRRAHLRVVCGLLSSGALLEHRALTRRPSASDAAGSRAAPPGEPLAVGACGARAGGGVHLTSQTGHGLAHAPSDVRRPPLSTRTRRPPQLWPRS
jgi:hypothetical protein